LGLIRRELLRLKPEVVGFSVRNIDNNDIQAPAFFIRDFFPRLIRTVRSLTQVPIVLGGAAVPVMPEELLRYTEATCAVLGDGETVFPLLLERLSEGGTVDSIPGVAWIEEGVYRANRFLPHRSECSCRPPDFHHWINIRAYLSRLSTIPVQTKLGCQFSCVYCTYRKIEGSRYRLSSPDEVLDTVSVLASRDLRSIEFVDNVFNSPYDHGFAVCERLASARLRASFQCLELNPLHLDDAFISVMERGGFTGIGITVESASDSVLHGLGKGFTADHVHRAAGIIGRHDLPCIWMFMMGGPNETKKTVRETLSFAERYIRPRDVAFFGMGIRVYPGTEIDAIARRQGLLSLSPSEMLEPVFYLSPELDFGWLHHQVKTAMAGHVNFISSDFLGQPILKPLHRIGYHLGLTSPLWRYTSVLRRGLRTLGMEV
ncbi:MAG: radical SAM protein, partial [Thermodesulfovibrionales bacterium]